MIIIKVFKRMFICIRTWIHCVRIGWSFDNTWNIGGGILVKKMPKYVALMHHTIPGTIKIGKNFHCANAPQYNSIGTIQQCVFNYSKPNSIIEIGDNVGISGSTINASTKIKIGNNVLIGSGCLITDTDSHPLNWNDRLRNDDSKIKSKPIIIDDNVFIGARSIILKGVTIGNGSVIGAGSVVTQSIPPNVVACGNPAKIIKKLKTDDYAKI